MRRSRSIHPQMFVEEDFFALPVQARTMLLAVGTYSDYANRFPVDMTSIAAHCGWAWDQDGWDRLVADGLIVIHGRMAEITFKYGHSRALISRWEAIRSAVFERDSYACQYCGDTDNLHCDHVHPKSRGGSDAMDNLVTACGACNMSKGSKTVEEWLS